MNKLLQIFIPPSFSKSRFTLACTKQSQTLSVFRRFSGVLYQAILVMIILLIAGNTNAIQEKQSAAEKKAAVLALKPPLTAFSRLPAFTRIKLSPQGDQIAFVQNYPAPHNVSVLTVLNPKTREMKSLIKSDNKRVKINWFKWATDEILIVSASYEATQGRVKYFQTRLVSVDVTVPQEDIELEILLKPKRNDHVVAGNRVSQFLDSVIDFLPEEPDYILAEADFDTPQQPGVYKLNIRNGKYRRVERGKRFIRSWTTDQQSQIRIGRARDYDSGKITYYERADEDTDFRVLFEYMAFEDKPISISGFGVDPNILYYKKYLNDKKALYKMNLVTKESELVLAHDDYDVSGSLIYSNVTNDAIGVYDEQSDYGRYYFDAKSYKFHKRLDKSLPKTENYIVSQSKDELVYVLYIEADDTPGMYLIGNKKLNTLELLTESYPELYGAKLAHHEKLTYKARDGVEVEAYLTLPVYGEAPHPTVIHPHGGPGARDYSGFDPWVSYLTSRGYAVLRPNFRGSSGYGYEFAQAQMGRWGLEMQDDITDATKFLIDNGTTNPEKVCIFGASYGGYAATMATVKTPDLFTCAVSFAGVTDLRGLVKNTRRFLGGRLTAENQIGDETDDLKKRSPLYNIDKIKTPILLMHGEEDRTVLIEQSEDFAEELKDAGKEVRYVEFADGGHNLAIQSNRTLFFEELDAFLIKHLGDITPE